jgi:hypothetical protein
LVSAVKYRVSDLRANICERFLLYGFVIDVILQVYCGFCPNNVNRNRL